MKRMSYQARELQACQDPRLHQPGRMHHACVQHDHWCPLLAGKEHCDCNPDILVLTEDGERYEIDREGRVNPAPQRLRCTHGFEQNG